MNREETLDSIIKLIVDAVKNQDGITIQFSITVTPNKKSN